MTRYRWYSADWPMPIRTLAKQLKKRHFDDTTSDGFVVDRVRDDYLEARFIEHFEFTETVTDPFGRELSFDRVEYAQSEFRASSSPPGLELTNAPRTSQALVSRLLEATSFSLAVTPLSVDVSLWAKNFQQMSNYRVIVDSLQIGSVDLGQGIGAKAVIRGDRDVRDAAKLISDGRRHVIEKMQLRVRGSLTGTVLISNNGAAKVSINEADEVAQLLRSSLASVMTQ